MGKFFKAIEILVGPCPIKRAVERRPFFTLRLIHTSCPIPASPPLEHDYCRAVLLYRHALEADTEIVFGEGYCSCRNYAREARFSNRVETELNLNLSFGDGFMGIHAWLAAAPDRVGLDRTSNARSRLLPSKHTFAPSRDYRDFGEGQASRPRRPCTGSHHNDSYWEIHIRASVRKR